MNDQLRSLLAPLLARRHSPAERRQLAQSLRELAQDQELLADADERTGATLRREQLTQQAARQRTGRPKGSGARFLRWEPSKGAGKASRRSGQLHVGRALWQELGEPARLDVQRVAGRLWLRPCAEGQGWAVSRPANGMPRLNIGDDPADALGLVEGVMPAQIKDGVIVTT